MQLSYGTVIRRALLAGAVVGALLAAYVYVIVEPTIDRAVHLEEVAAQADTHANEDAELFTRGQQKGGGVAAALIYALVVAGVFGTVYAGLRHRLPGATELARALWLAGVGFVVLALLPALKYPATPPGAADVDDAGQRTVLFVASLVAGLLVAVILTRLSGALRSRVTDSTRFLTATVAAVAAFALLLAVLPAASDSVDALPASLVWDFRIRSLGGLALLWGGLGVGLGCFLDRAAASEESGTVAVNR